jgi:hypothetical protein
MSTIWYSNDGSDLSVGDVSASDDLYIVSTANVSAGVLSGTSVTVGAGISFTLDPDPGSGSGQAPDGTTISITSSAGGSDANIGGTSSSGLVTILSNTFEASGTVSSGSDTTITASADIAPASIQSGGVLTSLR